jgi:hypothetical protein
MPIMLATARAIAVIGVTGAAAAGSALAKPALLELGGVMEP